MRRRDVPCSPCGSGSSDCGCCPPKSIKKINNIEPDDNGKFEVRAGTNVTITDITNGIEISSAGSVEDVVKTVNGELPDQNGDVTVDTGVMTVNGVSPDADGEVTITAGSNITITPDAETNSIEISASGGTNDWFLVTDKNWARFKDANVRALTDLYIVCNDNSEWGSGELFIPKGAYLPNYNLDLQIVNQPNAYLNNLSIHLYVLTNDNYIHAQALGYRISQSTGSGANQLIEIGTHFPYSDLYKQITDNTSKGIRLYIKEDVI